MYVKPSRGSANQSGLCYNPHKSMSKAEYDPEREARILRRVISDICELYLRFQRARKTGLVDPRNGWSLQSIARIFPAFSERIAALEEAIERAENTRIISYFSPQLDTITFSFPWVLTETQQILLDILSARCSTASGGMIDGVDPIEESNEMARALGVPEGARAEAMGEVRLGKVVELVLKGELKLTRQIPA